VWMNRDGNRVVYVGNNWVVVKLGGALITDKSALCTVRPNELDLAVKCISEVVKHGLNVACIHGAGSFGHIRARDANLTQGLIPEREIEQKTAISQVHSDLDHLHAHVLNALEKYQVKYKSIPARRWISARESSESDENSLRGLTLVPDWETWNEEVGKCTELGTKFGDGIVVVTSGDVIKVLGRRQFGVVSGDEILILLCSILRPKRAVFCMHQVAGVLKRRPKNESDEGQEYLIERIRSDQSDEKILNLFKQGSDSGVDVTGGILLKVRAAVCAARNGTQVVFVNGTKSDRITDACVCTDPCIGTIVE